MHYTLPLHCHLQQHLDTGSEPLPFDAIISVYNVPKGNNVSHPRTGHSTINGSTWGEMWFSVQPMWAYLNIPSKNDLIHAFYQSKLGHELKDFIPYFYTYFSYGIPIKFEVPMVTIKSIIFQDMTSLSEDSTPKGRPTFKYWNDHKFLFAIRVVCTLWVHKNSFPNTNLKQIPS
jgi:hypothetical protein